METKEEMGWYTLLDGSHSFGGMRVKKGGTIRLTTKEAEKLGDRVRMSMSETKTAKPTYTPTNLDPTGINASGKAENEATSTIGVTRDWSKTQDMKAAEVIALANETISVSDLELLYEVEEKGQNRPSVLKAIEKKVVQLEGGQ